MHGSATFLQDLAVIMITAGVVTVIFHRLRQPVVLGYIIAGIIIGPYTPPFHMLHNEHRAVETLAELGIVLLMFGLGLHFSLRRLASVGATAFIAAMLEILVMVLIGYQIGRWFGWSTMDCIFLGAILSVSSTTIIVKALSDLRMVKERFAELIFGILIVEDILAIAMIALLSSIGKTGSLAVGEVVTTLAKLTVFLAVVLVAGLLAVPPLLRYVAKFRSNEMLLITTLGLCFGVSLAALKMEYSVALGAFLIGAIIAEAREAGKVDGLIESVRDMFSAIFFVSVGLMIDPRMMVEYWLPIAVITVAVIVGKVMACGTGTFLAGHDLRTSLRVGMGVSQIGEFSFIIAQLGLTLKTASGEPITSAFLYPIAVAVSAITTLSTPYLIQSSDPLAGTITRRGPRALGGYLDAYSQWVAGLGRGQRSSSAQIRRLLWKWAMQIALNVTLLTGLFVAAVWFAARAEQLLPVAPRWTGGARGLVWLGALLLALPLLVASFRKVRAASMVIAEMGVPRTAAREQTAAIRGIVSNTILIAVCTSIVLWVLLLSSAILPPLPVLIAFAVLIGIVTLAAWSRLVKVYARAQIAIRETLTTVHAADEAPPPLPPILKDAVLETVTVPAGAAAAGRLIRELQLRTETGASIVGIEREGVAVINPGPDEELLAGDRVLLLGTAEQLLAARRALEALLATEGAQPGAGGASVGVTAAPPAQERA